MKKIKSIIIIILLSVSAYSQVAVTDAGATAAAVETKVNTGATLAKTTSMLKEVSEMRKKYDAMMENVEIVNTSVATGQQINNIMKLLNKINTNFNNAISYISNEDTLEPAEKMKFLGAFNKIISSSLDELDNAYKVTTSGDYKMTDAERLSSLNDISNRLNHQNGLINYFLNKIKASVMSVKNKKLETATLKKLNKSVKK